MLRTKQPSGTYPDLDISIAGIPCTVTAMLHGPDPDTGINESWVDDYEITHIAGRKLKKPSYANWLYRKASLPTRQTVEDSILIAVSELNAWA